MKKALTFFLTILIVASFISAVAEEAAIAGEKDTASISPVHRIAAKNQKDWKQSLIESDGDWAIVYYDENNNTVYGYADSQLAKQGIATQSYKGDEYIWMVSKYSLFVQASGLCMELNHAGFTDIKVVMAYVSGGKRDRYEDYYIAKVGDFSSASSNRPSVLYSITCADCKDATAFLFGKNMIVYDYFFGDETVVTDKEMSKYW